MNRVLAEVVTHAGDFDHPFMESRGGDKRALILVTTDKGLCGALNTNLLRKVSDEFVTDNMRVLGRPQGRAARHARGLGFGRGIFLWRSANHRRSARAGQDGGGAV